MYCWVPPIVCDRTCSPIPLSETTLEIVAVIWAIAPALVEPIPNVCAAEGAAAHAIAAATTARVAPQDFGIVISFSLSDAH
jgi:hypothetical protein